MYVGNLMLLALNLPLVGVFVSILRIPYAYLYPMIIMFCIIGVYEVNNSVVDVWIMLIFGVIGYLLKKFRFDPGAAGAGARDRADLRTVAAPVADHVGRLVRDLLSAPDALLLLVISAVLLGLAAWGASSPGATGAPRWRRRKPACGMLHLPNIGRAD